MYQDLCSHTATMTPPPGSAFSLAVWRMGLQGSRTFRNELKRLCVSVFFWGESKLIWYFLLEMYPFNFSSSARNCWPLLNLKTPDKRYLHLPLRGWDVCVNTCPFTSVPGWDWEVERQAPGRHVQNSLTVVVPERVSPQAMEEIRGNRGAVLLGTGPVERFWIVPACLIPKMILPLRRCSMNDSVSL